MCFFEMCSECFEDRLPDSPPKMVRQTNEEIMFCGNYPTSCAYNAQFIPPSSSRHVLVINIDSSDVSIFVEFIYAQLEIFETAGVLTYSKKPGAAVIGETILSFYVVNNLFHVYASNPDPKSLNHLIFCLRYIFLTQTLFITLDFEIKYEKWVYASSISLEPVHQYFRPSLKYPCEDDF